MSHRGRSGPGSGGSPIVEVYSRNRLIDFIRTNQAQMALADGANGQVQFNSGGSLAGSSGLVFDSSEGNLGIEMSENMTTMIHLDVNHGYLDWLSSDTGGGERVQFGGGSTTAGELYYLKDDGVWTQVKASTIATGAKELLAIAIGGDAAKHGMLIRGFFKMSATGLDGTWNEGVPIYVSTTAGKASITAPSTTGDFVRVVGYCTAESNVVYFNPSSTYIEIS